MALILGAVLALSPLLIAPHLLFYFDVTPKILVVLFGAATALVASVARGEIRAFLCSRAGFVFSVLLGLQFVSMLVSTVLSANPGLSYGGTNWRRLGLLVYAAILVFTLAAASHVAVNPRGIRFLCRVIAVTGIVAAGYGILQYFGWDPFLPRSVYHVGEGVWTIVRPPGTLGYVSYFATYLLIVAFTGFGLALVESSYWWRTLGWAAAAFSAAAIVLSGTRAAMLGFLAGSLLLWLFFRGRLRMAAILAVVAIIAGAGAMFYYSGAGLQLRSRTRWFIEDPMGGARLLLWRDSLHMARGRALTGYGPETFASEFPRYQSAALARAYPDFFHESPHNVFIDALCSQGLAGLLILIGTCGFGFWAAVRARASEPVLGAALAASLIAALVSLQFTCFVSTTALYFYSIVGLLVAIAAPVKPLKTHPGWWGRGFRLPSLRIRERRPWQAPPPAPSRFRACAWIAASVLPAVPLVWFGTKVFAADRALAGASRAADAGRVQEAVYEYDHYLARRPAGEGADLWFSRRMLMAAQTAKPATEKATAWRRAAAAAVRATSTAADRQNAWYSLAGFYAAQNDYSDTVMSLQAAIDNAPNWFKPHWMLARALQVANRMHEAEREAAVAARLDGGKNPEVALTLKEIRDRIRQRAATR